MDKVEGCEGPKVFLRKKDENEVRSEQSADYLFMGFRILGLNASKASNIAYIIYSVIFNGIVTIFIPFSFAVSCAQTAKGTFGISAFLTSVYGTIEMWGSSLKIITIAFMMKQLRACNAITAKMDRRCKEPDEVEELRQLRATGRRVFVLFTSSFLSYATVTVIGALMKREPAFGLYFPYMEWKRSRLEQITAISVENILIYIVCFQQVVNDSYGIIYMGILRTHMNLLKIRISKLGTNSEWTSDQNLDELKLCIQDHKNYIELFHTLAPVVSATLAIQFTLTATVLGVCLVNMSIFIESIAEQASAVGFILGVVIQAAPVCYYSQCLTEESMSLSDEIFYCRWADRDPRFRKMLVVFVQQAQRPLQLRAGKLFPINLDTMIRIGKFSFSLYTFIDQMNVKERLSLS